MDIIRYYLSQLSARIPSLAVYMTGIWAATFFAVLWQRYRPCFFNAPWTPVYQNGYNPKLRFNFFLFLSMLFPLLITALRYKVGTDYNTYIANYQWVISSGGLINFIFTNGLLEPGYVFISWISQFLGGYPAMFALCGIVTVAGFYRGITYHAAKISVGASVFLFMCLYFQMSLNIVRQYMAAGLLLCAVWQMLRHKPKNFVLLVLGAAMFHISALVMLPFYFFAVDKKWAKVYRLLVILGILLAFVGWPVIAKVIPYIPVISRFSVYTYPAGSFKPDMLIFSLPVVVPVLIFYKKLVEYNRDNKVLIDFILIGTILSNFKYLSEPLSRLALYFLIAQILVLPSLVYAMKTYKHKLMALFLVLMYGLGYWGTYYFLFNRAETFPYIMF